MTLHDAFKALIATGTDLTMRQADAMLLCATLPRERRTIRGLAADMGISKPAVTRAADKLQELGWIMRRIDPLDRRSVFLDTTREGREAIEPLVALGAVPVRDAA